MRKMHWLAHGLRKVQVELGVIMATQNFKRNLFLYLYGNLPFFKIHVRHFLAWVGSPGTNVISKCMLWVGPGAIL